MLWCFVLIDEDPGFMETRFYHHIDDCRSLVRGPRGVKKIIPRDHIIDIWEA